MTSVNPVDPYLFPARGRKRDDNETVSAGFNFPVDPYLFPARGRKRLPVVLGRLDGPPVDPYLFPARGRKL